MVSPNYKRDYGLRACAGLSIIAAFIMIFMSVFVFVARLEDLKSSKFPAESVPSHITSKDRSGDDMQTQDKNYKDTLTKLDSLWKRNRSVLASSSMLAILAGLLQLIFSGLVIFSDSKAMQLYIRKWAMIHFILVIILFIILLNTIVLTQTRANDNESWDDLTNNLTKHLKLARPHNDYNELYRFLGAGQNLIYIGVSTNLVVILVVMGAAMYFMRCKQAEYESYD